MLNVRDFNACILIWVYTYIMFVFHQYRKEIVKL